MPLCPAIAIRNVWRRQVEVIDVGAKLGGGRRAPSSIERVILPSSFGQLRHGTDDRGSRSELTPRANGQLSASSRAEIEQLVDDLRRDGLHLSSVPPAR